MATMYYRPYTSEPVKEGDFPPHDALETILPEYRYIFVDPHQRAHPQEQQLTSFTVPEASTEEVQVQAQRLLDYQMHELEKYRMAVKTMGQDIILLRQQIRDLEVENSALRSKLSGYSDVTKLILSADDLSSLARDDIANRYGALKHKLNDQTSELREYKERVRDLQEQLLKKGEREKELLRLSVAHEGQQELLQKLQERASRVPRLEEACRKQEKVIEGMEKLLNQKHTPSREDSSLKEVNAALTEENRRLRFEVQDTLSNPGRSSREDQDQERLNTLERLERAEGRIISLEKQLAENAKIWAREKSELRSRLRESEHGLRRPVSPLHNSYPKMKPSTHDDLWEGPWSKSSPRKHQTHRGGKGPALRH